MKKLFALLVFSASLSSLFAQALVNNNGANIYVKDGGFMIVKTSSVANLSGSTIENEGTITVEGFVQNDGTITGTGDTIRLFGDWRNNSAYTGNNSWVDMYGQNQMITGTAVTPFNNLALNGGAVLKRQTIDATTSGLLVLNNAELATDVNEMLVTNNNVGAVTRNNGFVSSVGPGKLSRATNTTSAYLFPLGSPSYVNAPSIFRPVEFTPASAADNVYGGALVKGDATIDGFNVNLLDDSLCAVNPNFYHRLYRSSGTDAAALAMFFNPATDGNWTDQAHWDISNRWNYLGLSNTGAGLGLSTVTVPGVSNFIPEPFALARKRFTVDAGPSASIVEGQSVTLDPTISTTNYDSLVWTPGQSLDCPTCENAVATPASTTLYYLNVTDGGCTAYDSVLITILNTDLLVPTAFSPNGDGANPTFRVLNKNLDRLNLQVFNRWGEKVYETNNLNDSGWDGFYKGIPQQLGVYVWQCQYQFVGGTKLQTAKGNVTLVR